MVLGTRVGGRDGGRTGDGPFSWPETLIKIIWGPRNYVQRQNYQPPPKTKQNIKPQTNKEGENVKERCFRNLSPGSSVVQLHLPQRKRKEQYHFYHRPNSAHTRVSHKWKPSKLEHGIPDRKLVVLCLIFPSEIWHPHIHTLLDLFPFPKRCQGFAPAQEGSGAQLEGVRRAAGCINWTFLSRRRMPKSWGLFLVRWGSLGNESLNDRN